MSKVSVARDEEKYTVTLQQPESLGITFHEAQLIRVLKAFIDEDYRDLCWGGVIGVSVTSKSVILYDIHHGKPRICITMTPTQAEKLSTALKEAYADLLYNTYAEERP